MTLPFVLAVAVLIVGGGLFAAAAGSWVRHPGPVIALYVGHVTAAVFLAVTDLVTSPDADVYDASARWRVDYWDGVFAFGPNDPATKSGYPTMLAAMYRVFGEAHQVYGALANAWLATLAFALIARSCQLVGWPQAARTSIFLGFLPAFMLWAGLSLREAGVWFLTALLMYAGACLRSGRSAAGWVAGFGGAAGLTTFRGSLAAVVVVGVVAGVYLSRRRATAAATALTLTVSAGVLLYVLQTGVAEGLTDQAQLNASRAELSSAGSGFETAAYTGPLSALTALPASLPRVVLGPYPTVWASVGILAPLIWAVWVWVLWNAWRGFRSQYGTRARWLWVPPAVMLILILAITSGNWGTMVRLREQVTLCLVPLVAVWVCGRRERREEVAQARRRRRRRRAPRI